MKKPKPPESQIITLSTIPSLYANLEISKFSPDFMTQYGNRHRSFGHGFIHGAEIWFNFFGHS